MAFAIVLTPESLDDLRRLPIFYRNSVRDALTRHLVHEPRKTSKSRIKQLKHMKRPQFRLRIGDIRVFHVIEDRDVVVLGVVTKSEAHQWLVQHGAVEK